MKLQISFQMSHLLAKQALLNHYLIAVTKEMYPDKISLAFKSFKNLKIS